MADILTPTLGESVSEATVARWTKKPGDPVKKDEVLVELETDKVSLEVGAPADGVLADIAAAEGATVVPGARLGTVTEGAAGAAAAPAKKAEPAKSEPAKAAAAAAPAPTTAAPTAKGDAAIEVKTPAMGESVAEGAVGAWTKKAGDSVTKDEVLVEIETDKVAIEVMAPADGTLVEIVAAQGASVKPGQVLAKVAPGAGGAASAAPSPAAPAPQASAPAATGGPAPMPSAQRIVTENKLDAGAIPGTGKDGRVTKGDALAALEARSAAPAAVAAPAAPRSLGEREERVKMTRLRQTIARRLKEAQNTAAMLTTFNEVDMSAVMALRNTYKDVFEKKHGVKLGFMSFFAKAVTQALKEIPAVNAEIDGQDIIYKNHYDIGVAVGTDKGLVVPVVRDVDAMSLAEIEKAIAELGKRARDGTLTIEDMQGGTFTITNGGVYGSLMSTPILNAPQSGILGMHNIVQRPVAVKDQVVIRPMMYLALSYDHRIVDGKEAVTFLVSIKNAIEDPQRLILDL
jgi:2-oxoglutarate dehydrogenase E2 component (dihydrolipoamide succinyltransferase)